MQEPGARDNISLSVVRDIAVRIKEVRDLDVQVAIVIGGGNIWRGLSASHRGMDRTTADYMGMLATVINSAGATQHPRPHGCRNTCSDRHRYEKCGPNRLFSGAPSAIWSSAASSFSQPEPEIRIFHGHNCGSAGKRNSRRCNSEATKVDGVYDRDPKKYPDARRFERLTFSEALSRRFADHGFDRVQPLHGQQDPHRRLRHV